MKILYLRFFVVLVVATPLVTAFTKPAAAQTYHTVRANETLYSIATIYHTSWQCIASANGITDPSSLHVGQRLYVPGASECGGASSGMNVGAQTVSYPPVYYPPPTYYNPPTYYYAGYGYYSNAPTYYPPTYYAPAYYLPPHAGDCYHRVGYGENLYRIALRYGASYWSLAMANGLYNPNYLYAGQVLRIPGCN